MGSSKYTPNQLRSMAQTVLATKKSNFMKYIMMLDRLQNETGLSVRDIERKIDQLALTGMCT